jgi:hypothetical protein
MTIRMQAILGLVAAAVIVAWVVYMTLYVPYESDVCDNPGFFRLGTTCEAQCDLICPYKPGYGLNLDGLKLEIIRRDRHYKCVSACSLSLGPSSTP